MKVSESRDVMILEAFETLKGTKGSCEPQEQCLEFLKKTLPLKDIGTAAEIKKELSGIKEFKDHQINKLIEISPFNEDQVNAIFSKERIKMEKEEIKKILNVFRSVRNVK